MTLLSRYAQSKKSNLSVQVDAAINSGNRCVCYRGNFAARSVSLPVSPSRFWWRLLTVAQRWTSSVEGHVCRRRISGAFGGIGSG